MKSGLGNEEKAHAGDGARLLKTEQDLDAEVAEKVMGYESMHVDYQYTTEESDRQRELRDWLDHVGIESIGDYFIDVKANWWREQREWSPSTDIAAAMQVIEHLCPTQEEYNAGRKSCRFILRQQDNGTWSVEARSPFLTSYSTP